MKRALCLLLALMMVFSLGTQAFAEDDVLYCRMCGRQIPTDSRVCPYCGEKVVHVTAAASKPADTTSAEPSAAATTPAPAAATDVKTALAQSSAPSPVTQSTQTEVSGPFNTTLGANGTSGRVRVTKSPTSESVPYGGSCSFIAHAANATSITWYIANSDASVICAASDAPYSVSGLYVSGANSDTLYLNGIPSWWNGCQVQACFTGEGGPVYTDVARIWTYQPVEEQSSGWSFWDWFNSYYWDDPYEKDFPWWYWLEPDNSYTGKPAAAPKGYHPEIDSEEAEVKHIGHYDPLHPWDSWWDPSGKNAGQKPGPAPDGFNPGGGSGNGSGNGSGSGAISDGS